MADLERTFFMVKPDAFERGLAGEIIGRMERRGLAVRALKLIRVSQEQAQRHYAEHRERPFFGELVDFVTSGPAVAMVLEGPDAVRTVRTMMGATDPLASAPGTIRGDYALDIGRNAVHGSDSLESAKREIGIFFAQEELV